MITKPLLHYTLVNQSPYPYEKSSPLNKKTRKLTLRSPSPALALGARSTTDPEIFINSICKAYNIQKLVISKLDKREILLLEPLIIFFEEYYPQRLTHVTLHTFSSEPFSQKIVTGNTINSDTITTDRLNRIFQGLMQRIASIQLLSAIIRDENAHDPTPLTKNSLSEFFKGSPNLSKLSLTLENETTTLTIPFSFCPQLEELTLRGGERLSEESFYQLEKCENLRSLTLLNFKNPQLFSSDYQLYSLTKSLSKLEILDLNLSHYRDNRITDKGLEILGNHCPNLTSLSFCFSNISETGFVAFIKKMKNLQRLSSHLCVELGEQALTKLASNCPNLKYLDLIHWKAVTEKGLTTLAERCSCLCSLSIKCCMEVSLEDVEQLLLRAHGLTYFSLLFQNPLPKERIKSLKQKYTHLLWRPPSKKRISSNLVSPECLTKPTAFALSKEQLREFLLEATRKNRVEEVLDLVHKGADLNQKIAIDLNTFKPQYEENPLAYFALQGDLKSVEQLRQAGANFVTIEKILGRLSQPKHLNTLQYLLKNGCNPNTKGEGGLTPLQAMIGKGMIGKRCTQATYSSDVSLNCMRVLVAAGAYTKVLYRRKYNLMDLALANKNTMIQEYLKKDLKIKPLNRFSPS